MSGLGIELQQLLFHLANMAIVFLIVWKLLYKPMVRFMDQRKNLIKTQIEEAAAKQTEAEQLKAKYDEMVLNAQSLTADLIERSKTAADDQARQIVASAQQTASEYMVRSKRDVQLLKSRARDEMRGEITDMAVGIARKILKREVTPEDNKDIIESYFSGKEI
ncbi:MAG: F0F1 ATP synthase subunit B [Eubacteriales bacterium]